VCLPVAVAVHLLLVITVFRVKVVMEALVQLGTIV
jgi:hypothetical protein